MSDTSKLIENLRSGSPFIPTTSDVRRAWIAWNDGQDDTRPQKPTWSAQEFDRWLAAHDADLLQSVLEQTPADCNCGFGGEHLDNNPNCRANAEQTPEAVRDAS